MGYRSIRDALRVRATTIGAIVLLLSYTALALTQMWMVDETTDEHKYALAGRLILAEGWEDPSTLLQGPIGILANQLFAHGRDVDAGLRLWHGPRDPALFYGRLGLLPFGWLCGCVVFAWARRAFGTRGGLLALGLFALNPIIIGYSALQAVDIAHAGTLLFALYLLWRFAERPTWIGAALVGAALGLSIATKYLALLALPVFVLVPAWRSIVTTRSTKAIQLAKAALVVAVIGVSACVTLHATYGFGVDFASVDATDYQSDTVRRAVSNPITRSAIAWVPAPLIQGVDFQSAVDSRAPASYLNGSFARRHATFYLWTLALKTPDWVVALVVVALVGGALREVRGHGSPRTRSTALILLSTAGIYGVYLSAVATLQTGIRYVMPLLPMMFILAASVVRWRVWRTRSSSVQAWTFAAFVALSVAELRAPWPHLISYYNHAAGGLAHGYEHFRSSNTDWGQYRNVDPTTLCPDGHATRELVALSGPRFGCLAVTSAHLTAVDPEDRRRTYHWIRTLERVGQPVAHFGAGWLVFHSTPAAWEAALRVETDTGRGTDGRTRRALAIAYLAAGDAAAFRTHRRALDDELGRPLDELAARVALARPIDASYEAVQGASRAWKRVGRHDLAASVLRDHPNPAIRAHPGFPLALGRALAFAGQLEDSAAFLERSPSRRRGRTARLLAELYVRLDRFELAYAVLREAAPLGSEAERERIAARLDHRAAEAAYVANIRAVLGGVDFGAPPAVAREHESVEARNDGSNR